MEIRFNIKEYGYLKIGDLWFRIDGKINEFLLKIKTPDLDDWSEITTYYFVYETINEYGCRQQYTEYVNCFEEIANKLYTKKNRNIQTCSPINVSKLSTTNNMCPLLNCINNSFEDDNKLLQEVHKTFDNFKYSLFIPFLSFIFNLLI